MATTAQDNQAPLRSGGKKEELEGDGEPAHRGALTARPVALVAGSGAPRCATCTSQRSYARGGLMPRLRCTHREHRSAFVQSLASFERQSAEFACFLPLSAPFVCLPLSIPIKPFSRGHLLIFSICSTSVP